MTLAIYHMSVKTIGRSQGRSATAACAYRSGALIEDRNTGQTFDYRRKGGIEHTELFAPASAPEWARDRQAVWNAVEQAETRKNSTVAREFEVALPTELSREQRIALVREFAGELVERHGMVVDASLHSPDRDGDQRNYHAHVLCSTRRIGAEGFTQKTRELDDKKQGEVEHWRARWGEIVNRHLERAGVAERINHRSLKDQGEEREPATHLGPNVVQMERKGMTTEVGEKHRAVEQRNAQIIDLAEVRRQIAEAKAAEPKKELGSLLAAAREDAQGKDRERPSPSLLGAARTESADKPVLNVPVVQAPRPPEIVLREWRAETDKQFRSVQEKAGRVDAYGRHLLAGHERRQEQHRLAKPAEPTGLLATMKRGAYEVAINAWEKTRNAIQHRIDRLSSQIDAVAGYMRRAFPHEAGPTKGEALADTRAKIAAPKLAAEYQQMVQQQAIQQAAQQHHHHHHMEQTTMAKEATLYTRSEADQAKEQKRLEEHGREAAKLSEHVEKEAQKGEKKPLSDHERRVQENLAKIKEQRAKERDDNEKGKSRGHGR